MCLQSHWIKEAFLSYMLHNTKHSLLIKVGKNAKAKKKNDFLSHYWVDGEKKGKQNGLFTD